MHTAYKTVIADTSCSTLLSKIGGMDILQKLFGIIYATVEVANEFSFPLPVWVKIFEVKDKLYKQLIEDDLDKGEASVLALAAEMIRLC